MLALGNGRHRRAPRRAIALLLGALVGTLSSLAEATPACPPGTGTPPLGWTGIPFLLGLAVALGLGVSAARHEPRRLAKILGAAAAFLGGSFVSFLLFFFNFSRCV